MLHHEFSRHFSSVTTILFDYDRTIAEVPINWEASRGPFREFLGQHFPGLALLGGLRIDEMEAAALEQFPRQADVIFDFRRKLEGDVQGGHISDPDVVDLIKSLRAPSDARRLFVVSNNLHVTIKDGLTALGILDCFEAILAVDDVGAPKPSPQAATVLRGRHGVDLASCILIGDSPSTDGEFCRRAGIPYFNVKTLTMHP